MFGMPGTSVGSEVNDAFRSCMGEGVKASRCWRSSCSERRVMRMGLFPDLCHCSNNCGEKIEI